MTQITLARKYRPIKIDQIYGQDVLKKILKHIISSDAIPQATILYGTRGIGKTTTARIIALAANCKNSQKPTTDPCLVCESCKAILSGSSLDVIEFDAASNTGVDSIRSIIDECRYPTSHSRYKIYIIDEVHMLSNAAFNAFLKLLEEPPSHVKFIFATTEIKKVPITILSRCQKLFLQPAQNEDIEECIKYVLTNENIKFESEAISKIAELGDGSFRDSLSLCQTILSSSKDIKYSDVNEILHLSDDKICIKMFDSIINGDLNSAIDCTQKIQSSQIKDIINQFLRIINQCLMHLTFKTNIPKNLEQIISNENINIPKLDILWDVCINTLQQSKIYNKKELLNIFIIRSAYAINMPTPADISKFLNDENVLKIMENFNNVKILK